MARTDDFQQARDLAASQLAQQDLNEIARRAGFELLNDATLRVPFLNRAYHVTAPSFTFMDEADSTAPVALQEQVLILHYLLGCRPHLKHQWVAYREIPGAAFYFGAFVKRAIEPLKKVFGQNAAGLKKAAAELHATPIETGDAGYAFVPLPFAPIQIIVWEGDEEFAAEANILFDASVGDYLSPEDAAWLASLTVYRLMSLGH